MTSRFRGALAALAAFPAIAAFGAAPAHAGYVFVGSWEVDEGPSWTTAPTAFSGVAAAAYLFGGSAADYVISTVDSNPTHINDLAWVSTYGGACSGTYPCGTEVADTYVKSTGGRYLAVGDTSAYVRDWAGGAEYVNYAFISAPEATTWAMMLAGFAGLGFAGFRARRDSATA